MQRRQARARRQAQTQAAARRRDAIALRRAATFDEASEATAEARAATPQATLERLKRPPIPAWTTRPLRLGERRETPRTEGDGRRTAPRAPQPAPAARWSRPVRLAEMARLAQWAMRHHHRCGDYG